MVPVATVLLVLFLSLVVIRFATVGLTLTGLSKDLAQFQALSAFTTSGFTTRESEDIVSHPVRRRIVMHLMLFGNAGVLIVVPSVVLSLMGIGSEGRWWGALWFRLSVLGAGVALVWLAATSAVVERLMWTLDSWALKHWGHIDVEDYQRLLRLAGDYSVCKIQVAGDHWLSGRKLSELALPTEGILVLGVERGTGSYYGAPRGDTLIEKGDSLIIYGRQQTLNDLDHRQAGPEGNMHHVMAVTRQIDIDQQERKTLEH